MPDRSRDWFRQAERDLSHAEKSLRDEEYEWACFAAQQAAEKALKALHLFLGQDVWGHVLVRLLEELPFPVPEEIREGAYVLDTYYIPTRYPTGFPEGAPFEHYHRKQAEEAIEHARKILEFVRFKMAEKRGSASGP